MSLETVIKDNNSGNNARVTKYNQLIVAPVDFSTPVSESLDVINTAFNFIEPVQGSGIVITDIIVDADNGVSNTTPAEVEVYQATSDAELTIDAGIVSPRLTRGDNRTLTGLNLLIPEGKWVNAKTNDNTILLTIMFYRVPVEDD